MIKDTKLRRKGNLRRMMKWTASWASIPQSRIGLVLVCASQVSEGHIFRSGSEVGIGRISFVVLWTKFFVA